MSADANQVAFLRWLSSEHPSLYATAMNRAQLAARSGSLGLGRLGWINFVVQAVATVGSAVIAKKQVDKQVALQKKALALTDAQAAADREQAAKLALLEVNTKRAAAGLAPVDMTGAVIPNAALPTPSALAPYAGAGPSSTIIPGVPDWATYTGGAVGLVALAKLLKVF